MYHSETVQVRTGQEMKHLSYIGVCMLQEDMYSYVTYSDDQVTKGKGTAIVEA